MMKICGLELEFDASAPMDLMRFKQAGEKMNKAAEGICMELPDMEPGDMRVFDAYVERLNTELRLFGEFIDGIFGAGIAKKLMGKKPSLTRVWEVCDALAGELVKHGDEAGERMKKYMPDRGTKKK